MRGPVSDVVGQDERTAATSAACICLPWPRPLSPESLELVHPTKWEIAVLPRDVAPMAPQPVM